MILIAFLVYSTMAMIVSVMAPMAVNANLDGYPADQQKFWAEVTARKIAVVYFVVIGIIWPLVIVVGIKRTFFPTR
jgi:hypothetical protein